MFVKNHISKTTFKRKPPTRKPPSTKTTFTKTTENHLSRKRKPPSMFTKTKTKRKPHENHLQCGLGWHIFFFLKIYAAGLGCHNYNFLSNSKSPLISASFFTLVHFLTRNSLFIADLISGYFSE